MTEPDLTPADQAEIPAARRSLRNWIIMGALVVVLGFVLFQALTSARVFFYNVDEAVELRDELGDDTFRLQGTVVTEPVTDENGVIVFEVAYGGVDATVRHVGEEPSTLFEIGIPVVAEGRWEGTEFESRQLLVKHSEAYVEDNPSRVEYELEES